MKIFIMRHGEAAVVAQSDQERRLTTRGQLQANSQGNWLKSVESRFDKVIVSPYVRAQETFAQINQVFENQLINVLETWDGITPYGIGTNVADYLSVLAAQGKERVLLVSHLPLVGEIIAELCGKNPASFYPATIVGVEWDGQHQGKVVEIKYPD
ncbi:phosphohistidine phosphatase SixA [Caviibacterium pharyngocola]|uniref:Phosphohistidine phosphatase SixA n=1 Tax=Caviibacterium pharyngocola TaxID=28159 RepID=A0A2M8RYQ2_9PAST|nr:phosphohistidine phosphatase SixA [Caviibacterium pharyngocola]PJG84011.1 phosphohistidine phosphatase SixA [Caviibacterium pharyngocola]